MPLDSVINTSNLANSGSRVPYPVEVMMSVILVTFLQGRAYVLDHDEEYSMTFPSAYGR